MRVLFVSHLFPPHGGGGVQRTVKFIKYLTRRDFRITVLTGAVDHSLADPVLYRDLPDSIEIRRARGLKIPSAVPWTARNQLTRWLLIVDEQVGWLPFAVREGKKLLDRRNPFDAIFSTSSPITDHLVAMRLRKVSGLPWVADFRDPWIGNFSLKFATPLHRRLCARLEDRIVSTADRIIVVSETMREQFLTRYPHVDGARFVTIPNGFDHEDYLDRVSYGGKGDRFNLVYTGSLYGSRQTARPVLEGLRQALDDSLVDRARFSMVFVGKAGGETRKLVDRFGLHDVVRIEGYRPHDQIIDLQLEADALLLIIGSGPGSEVVFTGKVFEYLAARRPIIAVVPKGPAATLVEETAAGTIVPPEDTAAIARCLADHFAAWEEGRLEISPDDRLIAEYRRSVQAEKLAGLLEAARRERG